MGGTDLKHNGVMSHRGKSSIATEVIKVGKNLRKFRSIVIDGKKLVVKGQALRIAELREEWDEDINNPEEIVYHLRGCALKIDLFTFVQRLPDSRPKYEYYMEWDNVAAVPISSYQEWFKFQVTDRVRNKIKKATKLGVVVSEVPFNDYLVRGILDIYNESPVRQGTRNTHYGMPFELAKRLNGTFLERSSFFAAFYKEELIAYVKVVKTDRFARVMGIMGKIKHHDKGAMNLLIAKAVKYCAKESLPYLVYAKYDYGKVGSKSLQEFKKSNGFEHILIPRYYVPLSAKGRLALRLGFHHSIKQTLPEWLVRSLLTLRAKYYETLLRKR